MTYVLLYSLIFELRSNHPGKLTKIGSELEKRLKMECRKAKAGNIRSRAYVNHSYMGFILLNPFSRSLLISLSIFRSLATECRRDIALLSPSLVGSVNVTLTAVPSDLEVLARVASVVCSIYNEIFLHLKSY